MSERLKKRTGRVLHRWLELRWHPSAASVALNALPAFWGMQGLPQIEAPLHVEPEIRAVAEHPRQHQRRVSGDGAPIVAQLVDVLARH